LTEKERKIASHEKYEKFKNQIKVVLANTDEPLTWNEIRIRGNLKQKFPNNLWVRKMEIDIGLIREKNKGKMYWKLNKKKKKQTKTTERGL